jgi:ATP-dependent helicase/nuclease subunit B
MAPLPKPLNISRVFLGWNRPPLPTAAAELVNRYRSAGTLDLSRTVVVVPGKRAGRRLLELLVDEAAREGLLLTPPQVITESTLPERLYSRQKPFASGLVRLLAWTAALRGLEPGLQRSLIPHPPHADDHLRWLRLGEMIGRMHVELAADGHDVDTVLRVAETLPGFVDHPRWEAIRASRQAYHDALHNHGLWDENSARLTAIEKREVACNFDIILIGTVDLNTVVTTMLRQVAGRVTAFVVAPEEEKDRFDDFGLLKPDAWQAYPIPVRDDQVLYAEDPAEQAAVAATWLAGLDGRFSIEDVAIGVPDPAIVPPLRRQLAQDEIHIRWVEGRTISDTGPYRLLAAAAQYASQRSYEAFAALVRHPDAAEWLMVGGAPVDLNALDGFHNSYLPTRMDGPLLEESELLRQAVERVDGLLPDAAGRKPLRDWAGIFAGILKAVYCGYGELLLDCEADRNLHACLERLLDALGSLRTVPPALDQPLPAMDAFTVAFEGVAGVVLPPLADQGAVELLGWLELTLDNAAAVLVTSFNDGFVPTSAGADPFLPDTLRAQLGIEHNARRYARDAYAATVLARSKQCFACIVARRDGEQNPLVPSRLLFTGPDTETIGRARSWAKGSGSIAVIPAPEPDRKSPFEVPRPMKGKRKLRPFSVTEFRTYLACKYRYYLKHVEGLSAVDDSGRELDGRGFGSLIHEVLEGWGNDPDWRHCGDAGQLAAHLIGRLRTLAGERFRHGRPAVRLQIAQAARRLKGFAEHQAGLVAQGWRIVYAESGRTTLTAEFTSSTGEPVMLRGRIDRIDYHERDNIVRILDYKTGDKAMSPDAAHRKHDEWTDLQLPLYRHLWRRALADELVPEDATVQLAYFQLPRESDEAKVAVAEEWSETLLGEADQAAREVIAAILAEEFWPPTEPAPELFEEYAAICLDNLQVPSVMDEEEAYA